MTDEFDTGAGVCEACEGPVQYLGRLGNLEHFRCRNCGMQQSVEVDDAPTACECDNTHQNNDTVCRFCWAFGRRKWTDPEV